MRHIHFISGAIIVGAFGITMLTASAQSQAPARRQSLACTKPASAYVLPCLAASPDDIRRELCMRAGAGEECAIGFVRGCAPDRAGSQRYEIVTGTGDAAVASYFLVRKNARCGAPQAQSGGTYTAPLPPGWPLSS